MTDHPPITKLPAKAPCKSCPYRRDAPSGLWEAEEYLRLPRYDGEIYEQAVNGATALFGCHQQDGRVCAGWAGHREPMDLLAVRMAVSDGRLPPEIVVYAVDTTELPLFTSGAETAQHGLRDVEAPGPEAQQAIDRLRRAEARREER